MNEAKTLMPALPSQHVGWGRLRRIIGRYSTAPMELKLGFGAMVRGAWQWLIPHPTHPFVWTGLALEVWGIIVLALGAAQFFGCLYRWEKIRTWAASMLVGALIYIVAKYAINAPNDIAFILYGTLLIGEVWIAVRGWPVFGAAPFNGDVQDDN
jgi:hypothetical protein